MSFKFARRNEPAVARCVFGQRGRHGLASAAALTTPSRVGGPFSIETIDYPHQSPARRRPKVS